MPEKNHTAVGRNNLEKYCWTKLTEAGIQFDYERVVELLPAFLYNGIIIEKGKRGLSARATEFENMEYKPDFMGADWVIETKGLRRPDFDLRWKLFKHKMRTKKMLLLMPGNMKQVDESIELLKLWINGKRDTRSYSAILQLTKDFKQPAKKHKQSKVSKTKEG